MTISDFAISDYFNTRAPPQARFYMPPEFTKAQIAGQWDMPPYYYIMEFECPITNKGDGKGTHTIYVGNNYPQELPPWSFELTLGPGETYLWTRFQLAIWPMTFYLQGDWEENNYSEGIARWMAQAIGVRAVDLSAILGGFVVVSMMGMVMKVHRG